MYKRTLRILSSGGGGRLHAADLLEWLLGAKRAGLEDIVTQPVPRTPKRFHAKRACPFGRVRPIVGPQPVIDRLLRPAPDIVIIVPARMPTGSCPPYNYFILARFLLLRLFSVQS